MCKPYAQVSGWAICSTRYNKKLGCSTVASTERVASPLTVLQERAASPAVLQLLLECNLIGVEFYDTAYEASRSHMRQYGLPLPPRMEEYTPGSNLREAQDALSAIVAQGGQFAEGHEVPWVWGEGW